MLNHQWIYDDFHGDSITKIEDMYGKSTKPVDFHGDFHGDHLLRWEYKSLVNQQYHWKPVETIGNHWIYCDFHGDSITKVGNIQGFRENP